MEGFGLFAMQLIMTDFVKNDNAAHRFAKVTFEKDMAKFEKLRETEDKVV